VNIFSKTIASVNVSTYTIIPHFVNDQTMQSLNIWN